MLNSECWAEFQTAAKDRDFSMQPCKICEAAAGEMQHIAPKHRKCSKDVAPSIENAAKMSHQASMQRRCRTKHRKCSEDVAPSIQNAAKMSHQASKMQRRVARSAMLIAAFPPNLQRARLGRKNRRAPHNTKPRSCVKSQKALDRCRKRCEKR